MALGPVGRFRALDCYMLLQHKPTQAPTLFALPQTVLTYSQYSSHILASACARNRFGNGGTLPTNGNTNAGNKPGISNSSVTLTTL